jgi:hypothetical protein
MVIRKGGLGRNSKKARMDVDLGPGDLLRGTMYQRWLT